MRAVFAKQGGAGQKFKVHLEKLNKVLSLPKGAREELGISGEEGLVYDDEDEERQRQARKDKLGEDEELDMEKEREYEAKRYERKMNAAIFGAGFYHIIPSFYKTLMYLKK